MHLVGFLLKLNYDARNHELKKKIVCNTQTFTRHKKVTIIRQVFSNKIFPQGHQVVI